MMNAVVYYSNTNQSKRIAEYFSAKLNFPIFTLNSLPNATFERIVLVFPVHCQNAPNVVRQFLSRLKADNLALIATYGRMNYGNVLNEIQRKFKLKIVAGAYIPTKHSYLNENEFNDFELLEPIFAKLSSPIPSTVSIPKAFKNPFSDFFPTLRSRLGVKIKRNSSCNGCGICAKNCPLQAIQNGKTNKRCIRCLRCVEECPKRALSFRLSLPMRLYLRKRKRNETLVFV